MNRGIIELSALDLVLATGLVALAGAVSLGLRLGLERRLAVAALRTVVQLLLVGYVLKWVFAIEGVGWLIALVAIMIAAASVAAVRRPSRTIRGATGYAFITLVLCGLLTTFAVTRVVIHVDPWYKPQYLIPLLGMVLGNSLTGISLCLDEILEQFVQRRALVEMELLHGATRWEAARDVLVDAVRAGMIPIINSMMVVGVVALPGMMTGQILAGVDPVEAVKYQVVVMFMIAAATSLGCMMMALIVFRLVFNDQDQLRTDRIRKQAT